MQTSIALVAIVGMLVSFGLPILLVALILHYKHRRTRLTHETIAQLAEKGLPVPPQLLEPSPRRQNASLRASLILVGLGIGPGLFFYEVKVPRPPPSSRRRRSCSRGATSRASASRRAFPLGSTAARSTRGRARRASAARCCSTSTTNRRPRDRKRSTKCPMWPRAWTWSARSPR